MLIPRSQFAAWMAPGLVEADAEQVSHGKKHNRSAEWACRVDGIDDTWCRFTCEECSLIWIRDGLLEPGLFYLHRILCLVALSVYRTSTSISTSTGTSTSAGTGAGTGTSASALIRASAGTSASCRHVSEHFPNISRV